MKNAANEARLIRKYGGIEFDDEDEKTTYVVSKRDMKWYRKRKKTEDGGWTLECYPLLKDGSVDFSGEVKHWTLCKKVGISITW